MASLKDTTIQNLDISNTLLSKTVNTNFFFQETEFNNEIKEDAFDIFEDSEYFQADSNFNGYCINTTLTGTYYSCYIGNREFVVWANNYLRKININILNSADTVISPSMSIFYPCYVGSGEIVYSNGSDSNKLYKKSVNDNLSGTAITSAGAHSPCYIGNGEIVYKQASSPYYLYKKDLNYNNGSAITSVASTYPCYIGNGEIVYSNASDSNKLYKKSVDNTSNGVAITSVNSGNPCYIGNGEIVYSNGSDSYKLYKKSISKNR